MQQLNLRQLRENKGFTQKEISKKLNKTATYISLLEAGERNPSDKLKEELALLYNVSIADIYLAVKLTKCEKGGDK